MKVALLADIHGNTWALDAVLADLDPHRPDLIVCLGDVTGHSPQPQTAVQRLRSLGCPGVVGNGDAELLDMLDPEREAGLFALLRAHRYPEAQIERRKRRNRWVLDRLTPDDIGYLRSLQQTLEVPLGGGETLLCFHASPRSYLTGIRATLSEADLDAMLSGYEASVVACGHTHAPLLRPHSDKGVLAGSGEQIIVNPGSVARFIEPGAHHSWTRYAQVERDDSGIAITFQRVSFDARPMVEAAYASGMPDPEIWLYKPDHG